MQKFILAVSPDAKLLMQMQSHLQEGGRFSVICASSGKEALASLGAQDFDLAIIDGEIDDTPVVPLTRDLVAMAPNLRLLIFSPQNNPHHPALRGLVANGFLNKPFFGPEVSEKIYQALEDSLQPDAPDQATGSEFAREWIQNPETGAKQIEQILASTTALAGMLLLHSQVLAGSGLLTEESSTNIINYLNRYWTNIQSGELFRYLTMEHEASSYIIYAAPLIKGTAIALVYNSQKPIQEIRGEVSRLRKAFVEKYSTTGELRNIFSPGESVPPAVTPPSPKLSTNRFKELAESTASQIQPPVQEEEAADQAALSDEEIASLNLMLAEMPSPDPEGTAPLNEDTTFEAREVWSPDETMKAQDTTPLDDADLMTGMDHSFPSLVPEEPATDLENNGAVPAESIEEDKKGDDFEVPSPTPRGEFPDFNFTLPWEDKNAASVDEGTQPVVVLPSLPEEQAEPVPAGDTQPTRVGKQVVSTPYTFLMFPADPGQFITRDLAALCNQHMPVILSSFDWQMTAISVRPLYLQWSATIPPCCRISEKLADIRLQLNTLFFNSFPKLLQANPNGDFWLPGYFALSGSTPPSSRMINDFIVLFRQVEPQLRTK